MNIYLKLDLQNEKSHKIRSYIILNNDKIKELNIILDIEYIDLNNTDFYEYEKNVSSTPYLFNKKENIILKNYNKIIDYLTNII